ncbi:MAG TPA: trypsin-like peptidase domain-containing protein [Anaerolineae bacterium]|nr:trypsin-like peptidase domain-containing protein [Anaerolineae bacterium]
MWKTALASFISAVLGGLLVFSAVGGVAPTGSQDDGAGKGVQTARRDAAQYEAPGDIYKRFAPGVVHIRSTFTEIVTDFFGFPMYKGTQEVDGSGFIIDKSGLIVTNAHVVQGTNSRATDVTVFLDDKTGVKAKLLGVDISTDLALLRIDPGKRKLTVLELGDSSKLNVGDTVYAIGSPFGLDGTMTQGIVSALNRTIDSPNQNYRFKIRNVIQTDAAVNHGNSGGPLINSTGEVIGINSQIAASSPQSDFSGIAFAVPSNTVKDIISQIRGSGRASHAWMGITGAAITKDIANFVKLPVTKGIMVGTVIPKGPAEKAGLKGGTQVLMNNETGVKIIIGGDIITKIDNAEVATMDDILEFIDRHKVGDVVELVIYRGNKKDIIKLKLAERPQKLQDQVGARSPQGVGR